LIALLEAGWINALVIQDPFRMGETALEEAVKALRGEKMPKKIALPPRVVDLKNLHDPAIQTQLNPDLEKYLSGTGS
jgi:ribose transport system substrate-binding protein